MDADLAALLLRVALGPMLVAHGYNKAFGSGGLQGTTRWFAALGLRPAHLHARCAAVTEIAAGIMLTVGLLTPAVCAAYVGLMTVASLTDHRGKGYFVFKGGLEYTLLVGVVAVGLAALGPGTWSVDHLVGLDLAGWGWSLAAAVVGVASALGMLAVCYRPEKTAETAR